MSRHLQSHVTVDGGFVAIIHPLRRGQFIASPSTAALTLVSKQKSTGCSATLTLAIQILIFLLANLKSLLSWKFKLKHPRKVNKLLIRQNPAIRKAASSIITQGKIRSYPVWGALLTGGSRDRHRATCPRPLKPNLKPWASFQ